MKGMIRWAIGNSPAMNTIMVGLLVVGTASLVSMRREVFPDFELEILIVTVPYPGASPSEVEEGICQKVEEAVYSVEYIKKVTSVAREGAGFVIIELDADVPDVQRILAEVRSEVDRIPSWPELAEDAEVEQLTTRSPAIFVGLTGPSVDTPQAELEMRNLAEQIRDEILQLGDITQANIVGAKDYQIDIEIPEETLRKYGLTLGEVAAIVRRENVEIPGGSMRTKSQELLLRGKNKQLTGTQIAKIPLLTQPNGAVLTVGDLGVVRDDFSDSTSISSITVVPTDDNGQLQSESLPARPGLAISIDRTSSQDLLAMVDKVKAFVAERDMPPGYELHTWWDQSVNVKDRMDLLIRNGAQGLVLVFIVLALFLELRLAFWVAMGIPIAILGSGIILLYTGQTINQLTMFAFLMALGIIVDDAIVVGENIYAHRQRGKDAVTAAVDGTAEVLPSVTASVLTTVIAFMPLFFVSGVMGKFIAVMPLAVIGMLGISLFESMFILPCHLGHDNTRRRRGVVLDAFRFVGRTMFFPLILLDRAMRPVNRFVTRILNWFVTRVYLPLLRRSVDHPSVVVAIAIGILVVSAGFMRSGRTPFQIMPKLDSYLVRAVIRFPDGTPAEFTDRATQQIEAAIGKVHEKYAAQGMPLLKVSHRTVGYIATMEMSGPKGVVSDSHIGGVNVELVDTSQRTLHSEDILAEWREAAGDFPGAESVTFGTPNFGPGGTPIEFKLVSDPAHFAEVEEAVEVCKEKLATYKGVFDIEDDSQPGKWEFQLTVKDKAKAMGVPLAALAETVRSAYYGDEVMRLQRGRHEVKLMVRYPRDDRHSLGTFDEIRVKTPDGAQRPITELADVKVERGYSEFNRIDQKRAITVSADIEDGVANAHDIVKELKGDGGSWLQDFFRGIGVKFGLVAFAEPEKSFQEELLEQFPHVGIRWEGQQEQTNESVHSMVVGFAVAILAMFMLLTVEFRSYFQPLLILMIIPFGAIGAVMGHFLMGLNISLFTLFGLVALTGVVVNDSIVLIDFINRRIRGGMPLKKALVEAGRRRFRAVLLTSATTIAGLLPILTERSFQAQILIPMANVLVFGLMMTTLLVLFLVPAFYYIVARLSGMDPDEPIREEYEPDDVLDDVDVAVDELDREAPASVTHAAEPIAS